MLESPTRRPQVLHRVKAFPSVLFSLIWLCGFPSFVLMFLSDLICIQITSPGGSPIRGKNAVRAFRHTTPRHATTVAVGHLHSIPSSPSPPHTHPDLSSLFISSSSPHNTTSHHTPPLSVIPSCGLIHYKSALWRHQLRPPRVASPPTHAF